MNFHKKINSSFDKYTQIDKYFGASIMMLKFLVVAGFLLVSWENRRQNQVIIIRTTRVI